MMCMSEVIKLSLLIHQLSGKLPSSKIQESIPKNVLNLGDGNRFFEI